MSLGRLKNSLGVVIFITISVLVYSFKDTIVECVTGLPSFVAVFALSFIGASSVIIPVPYTAIIFVLASKGLDPLVTAIAGGAGSGLGEFTGWVVGRLVSRTLEGTKYIKQVRALIKLAEVKGKHVLTLAIFVFALTPLPDDLLFIVLGFLKYDLLRALPPCMLGKAVMLYLITFFGKLTWEVAEGMGLSEELLTALTVVMLTIILAVLAFVKWDRLLEKYLKVEEKEQVAGD
jgi:membrane protein YqaA with SNARE-associated domain